METTMRKLLTLLIALALTVGVTASSFGGSMMLTGVGPPPVAGAAFTGPGDVKTGWKAWWGTRAFSNATLGTRLIHICDSTGGTDVTCADASSNASTGVLVIPGSRVSFCPGVNCTIKTYYDQSGASACSGACDTTQATIASRAILTANALGASTGTCGVFTAASSQQYSTGNIFTGLAQPYTVSAVVEFTSSSITSYYFGTTGSIGFGEQGSTFRFFASSNVLGSASNTSAVALQNIAAGAGATASFVVNNSTVGSCGRFGNTSIGNALVIGQDLFGDFMSGTVCEVGVYPAAFTTTDASNMYGNQHTFWGF